MYGKFRVCVSIRRSSYFYQRLVQTFMQSSYDLWIDCHNWLTAKFYYYFKRKLHFKPYSFKNRLDLEISKTNKIKFYSFKSKKLNSINKKNQIRPQHI